MYTLTLQCYSIYHTESNKQKMPSSSRKKNKGKGRKAKKEEADRLKVYNTWKGLVQGIFMRSPIHCNHGLVEVPDISHPVSRFMHSFFWGDTGRRDSFILSDAIQQQHEDVWNNECYRKMSVQMLICIAATNLIGNKQHGLSFAFRLTNLVLYLENYEETLGLDDSDGNYRLAKYNHTVASKNRDVGFDIISRRDVIKFYRKRMNCKCLKKMHLEARKILPKLGQCHHCKVEKERTLLMVCSRCRIYQYCSRKCQVAASPKHREDCDKYVKAHRQQTIPNESS